MLAPWEKSYEKPWQCIKKQRCYFADKSPSSQSYGFSSSHVQMWELNHKEAWVLKYDAFELWCWSRLWRVPWTARRSNQSVLKDWIIIGRTDTEAEAPLPWPPDVKSWLTGRDPGTGKDPGTRKDWKQKEKGMTEDKIIGWHRLTQWAWVWAISGRWWRKGKPGVL